MGDDTVKWALIDTLRVLNRLPFGADGYTHPELERIAHTLGIDIAADRHVYEATRPVLKLARTR